MLGSGYSVSVLCRLAPSTHSAVQDFCTTFDRIPVIMSAEVLALHFGPAAGKGVRKLVVQKGDSGAQRKWGERCGK